VALGGVAVGILGIEGKRRWNALGSWAYLKCWVGNYSIAPMKLLGWRDCGRRRVKN